MIDNKKDLSKQMCEEKTCVEEAQGGTTGSMENGGANGGHITSQSASASASTENVILNGHHQQNDDCNEQGTEALTQASSGRHYDGIRNGHDHLGEDSGGELSPTSTDSGVISPSSTPDVMTPAYENSQQTLGGGGANEQDKDNAATLGDGGKQLVGRTAPLTADGTEEVVLIQDTSFNIKIVAPGCDPFDLQVRRCEWFLTECVCKTNK